MPCNCRKCDCIDRKICYIVEARLNAMACVFDAVAGGLIGSTDPTAFSGFNVLNDILCQDYPLWLAYELGGNFRTYFIFDNIEIGYPPSLFLPAVSINSGEFFLKGGGCLPIQVNACLACNSRLVSISTICSIQSDVSVTQNDLSAFASMAQNFRYAASVFGCQN